MKMIKINQIENLKLEYIIAENFKLLRDFNNVFELEK